MVRIGWIVLCYLSFLSFGYAQVLKYEMVKLSDGVYAAIRDVNNPYLPTDGNSILIINEQDVIVIDTNITPSSARAVLGEIRKLTNKPVRYIINTHHHGDHIYGNRVYQEAFPQVEIIGQTKMRDDFLKLNPSGRQEFIDSSRKTLAEAPEKLRSGKKEDGQPMTEKEKESYIREVEMLKIYLPELEEATLIAPTMTVDSELTLYRGERKIQLLYLGRGNTQGDLVVYLPKEKILITGDLLVYPIPFAFESYISEWIDAMKKLRAIHAEIIVPGHGSLQKNKEYIDQVTALLEFIVKQTQESVARGLSLEETKKVVDLSTFRKQFAGEDRMLNASFDYLIPYAVDQAYQQAKGETKN